MQARKVSYVAFPFPLRQLLVLLLWVFICIAPICIAAFMEEEVLVGNSDGSVSHWHMTSGKCLHSIVDEENQIYAIDYRHDGGSFATAGKDKKVRVYDEATKTMVTEMGGGYSENTSGHSNRVFSLKFHPLDENVLLSAGWDNTVQMWDVRMEQTVRHLFGPHICGDAMDIRGNTIVTGEAGAVSACPSATCDDIR